MILLISNALIGICLLEWAWKKNLRFRKPIAELDKLMPAFRRYDAENWAKWKHYPGAMTLMIPRFLTGVLLGFIFCILISLALIGQSMEEPIKGRCKKCVIRSLYKFFVFLFQLFNNGNLTTWKYLSEQDVGYYSEWLGPKEVQERERAENDYMEISEKKENIEVKGFRRIPKRGNGPASTIICNHISWIEMMALI